ncbi:hypothetical protein Hypma_000220 [Hypsizygus marmoreus]|uniref:Uncharacterized protein n=1 Tax=Hypsizygus marmoreus TaxID=39966 RepID=A0A369JFU9_HYPMA|nr:hypothetical protein Hypma_000220 [Hypsizygus marmoreus]
MHYHYKPQHCSPPPPKLPVGRDFISRTFLQPKPHLTPSSSRGTVVYNFNSMIPKRVPMIRLLRASFLFLSYFVALVSTFSLQVSSVALLNIVFDGHHCQPLSSLSSFRWPPPSESSRQTFIALSTANHFPHFGLGFFPRIGADIDTNGPQERMPSSMLGTIKTAPETSTALALLDGVSLQLHLPSINLRTIRYGMPRLRISFSPMTLNFRWAIRRSRTRWTRCPVEHVNNKGVKQKLSLDGRHRPRYRSVLPGPFSGIRPSPGRDSYAR